MRMLRKLTQQRFADMLNIALNTYQKYEQGERCPSLDMLIKIADILEVPTDYLLGRDSYLKSLGVSVDVSLKCPPRRPKPQKNL